MGCKAPISEKEKTLCVHCRPKEGLIYAAKLREVSLHMCFHSFLVCMHVISVKLCVQGKMIVYMASRPFLLQSPVLNGRPSLAAGERAAVAFQPVVDTMSRLPRIVPSRCAVLKQGLSNLLQAQEGSNRLEGSPGSTRSLHVVAHVTITWDTLLRDSCWPRAMDGGSRMASQRPPCSVLSESIWDRDDYRVHQSAP